MLEPRGKLLTLAGRLRVKSRVQHPQVKPRKDRTGWPWVFRYWHEEVQPDASVKTLRKYQDVGHSKGDGRHHQEAGGNRSRQIPSQAECPHARDCRRAGGRHRGGAVRRGCRDVPGRLSRPREPDRQTDREKETLYLDNYIVPRWGRLSLNRIHPKAVEDWLHTTFDSWWTMHGVRAIMSRIFYYAEGHGLWEEGRRSPTSKAKLGKKRHKYERRILSFEETARVLARLEEPNALIIETCIATGARISEVLGLKWKHVNLDVATIRIEQRVWHQDGGRPKREDSRRVLGIGDLGERYRARAAADGATPEEFVFQQNRAPGKPLWDSGIRDALHQAAEVEACDFPGLGPHSFRRANITWRQQVGGSAIEASKIAGHSDLQMTDEYTFVAPERQNELTRRIQEKLAEAASKQNGQIDIIAPPIPGTPDVPPGRVEAQPVATLVQ
jgi:integrase